MLLSCQRYAKHTPRLITHYFPQPPLMPNENGDSFGVTVVLYFINILQLPCHSTAIHAIFLSDLKLYINFHSIFYQLKSLLVLF